MEDASGRSYLKYIAGLLLFGSNGIIASNIALSSSEIVLTRTLISERIWSSHFDVDTNLLDVYMSRVRNKLETAAQRPVFKTVRGIGYQML